MGAKESCPWASWIEYCSNPSARQTFVENLFHLLSEGWCISAPELCALSLLGHGKGRLGGYLIFLFFSLAIRPWKRRFRRVSPNYFLPVTVNPRQRSKRKVAIIYFSGRTLKSPMYKTGVHRANANIWGVTDYCYRWPPNLFSCIYAYRRVPMLLFFTQNI